VAANFVINNLGNWRIGLGAIDYALNFNIAHKILIHIGLDTVHIKGEGFKILVNEGDKITKGQKILRFDLEFIKKSVPSTITPVIFTNRTKLNLRKQGKTTQGNNGIVSFE
jgi:PTS system N-acetylglucosamine-specific IIC component